MADVIPIMRRQASGAAEAGWISWESFQLAYEVHGPADGLPVVLVHGLLLESSCNRDLAIALAAEGYRVVLLDLLGHGASSKPGHAKWLRIDLFAEQLRACLDQLGIEKAVVGGISLGAITSLQFAAQWPERVEALFLEMPVMERAAPAAALMLVPVLGVMRLAAPVVRGVAKLAQRLPQPRRNMLLMAKNAISQQPEDISAIIHGILVGPVVPARHIRQKITAPALVIAHGGDWLHNLEDARVLARELPNARFVVAKSILELRSRPQRLWPKILSFLAPIRDQAVA